jgi:homoserine kinase type II
MLTTNDITRVLAKYDLGTLAGVVQTLRGYVNETAVVQTCCGRFVVRRNHRRLREADHHYRHQLINWLVEHNFPTPAIVSARDGSTLVGLDGRYYEIQVYIAGSDHDPSRLQQLLSIGGTLARYHSIVRDFTPRPALVEPRYCAITILRLIERLLERDPLGELSESLAWYDRRAATLRRKLPGQLLDSLPHLVIHGDIHSDNLLFNGDDVSALLDYDQVSWNPRLDDLADALVSFATASSVPGWTPWGVFQGPLDEERALRLISGYAAVAPLTPLELTHLPTIIELIWLQGELGRVISTPEGAPDYHQEVLGQGRSLSDWITERSARLVETWTEAQQQAARPVNRRWARLVA